MREKPFNVRVYGHWVRSNICKTLNKKVEVRGGLSHSKHTFIMSCSRNYPHLPWTLKHKSHGHHRCQGKFIRQSVSQKKRFIGFPIRISGHVYIYSFIVFGSL